MGKFQDSAGRFLLDLEIHGAILQGSYSLKVPKTADRRQDPGIIPLNLLLGLQGQLEIQRPNEEPAQKIN